MCNNNYCVVFEIKLGTVQTRWMLTWSGDSAHISTQLRRDWLYQTRYLSLTTVTTFIHFFAFYSNGSEFATNTRQNYIIIHRK